MTGNRVVGGFKCGYVNTCKTSNCILQMTQAGYIVATDWTMSTAMKDNIHNMNDALITKHGSLLNPRLVPFMSSFHSNGIGVTCKDFKE